MGKKIFSTQEINKKCYSCRVYAEGNHIISDYINTQGGNIPPSSFPWVFSDFLEQCCIECQCVIA